MLDKIFKQRKPRNLLLIFEILSILLLFTFNNNNIDRYIVILFLGLILIVYISNLVLGKVSSGDNYIFLIVSMLLSLGIITIYRLSPKLGLRQLIWVLAGILVFYLTYFIIRAMRRLEYMTGLYLGLSILFFLLTIILAPSKYGAKNWIEISEGITIQLSEFTKILVIFLIASFYTTFQTRLKKLNYKYTSYYLMGVIYIFVGFLFIQRDLGTAAIFIAIYTLIQYIYDEDRVSILVNVGLMAIGSVAGYFLFSHVRNRVDIWLNPWTADKVVNSARQIVQSLFGIGEGGFIGQGIGLGYPKQIAFAYSDVIFSAICEEMGVLTGIGIIMLYMLLVYRAIKIALNQEYLFYRILALSVAILFTVQAFLNIGGVIKLIPMTGLTLPFISYGGSSLISSFVALGILQVTSEDLSYKYEKGVDNE
ncbi:MAG: FtsW/RodA/SpoVE family cell cycle protein [Peptoniphilus harei]|uniref:FtsW/RodA/SpoVE family cell cycle protein n=1 Tax=Peptoniphilus TaxID=162289 RepID=UPI0011DC85D6|nr:FtsW/RodA/SpoVE family cell cycle protein [Peptoniphilus harei]MDK7755196.1 FtsW/RodA/SpoVE family cell cycle protein [Peptoniphilus harei]MDK7761003.1 FtsW/RodA/SpoVE family cell cycle protein [Peptoniphilus harei]MDK8270793.1 FtsW/RodA/SpoVE family cell cycle protein [Peptoniphilus harei]MDK8339176.1 FtsW/RodA/SpoVE family cell cycle protein [Peptoniphilus harei]MDU5184870.1 FtsW/RodA/SpoVE family cell cycle protein [Peptoniphilus harei]